MQWPDYFPENCPPENAQAAFGQVYRLVDNDPPTPDDFQSWREQHPNEQCPKTVTECQACGLSVFTSISDIEVAQRKVRRLRNKKIAVGNLTIELGQILPTPSQNTGQSHHTWWIPNDTKPWTIFHVINFTE